MVETIHETRRRGASLLILVAIAAGFALRLWNLGDQVMAGDELHAVRAALARPMSEILFVYQAPDNCIPLTVFDRLVLDAGVRLSEWIVRAPVLLCGLALLVAAPLWAWRRLGPEIAVVVAALVAMSPALVFYSRIARSYAPAALFGFGAIAAFDAWMRHPGWRPATAYVLGAAVALWFHLGAGPLVVSPLLVGGVWVLARRGRGALAAVVLAAATAAAFLALLLPARATLLPLAAEKHGRFHLAPGEGAEVAALLAGMRWPLAAAAFWVLVAVGLARLARRDAWLAALAGAALLGQLGGIVLLAPVGHRSPVILGRYLMPALPWALVLVAVALGMSWSPSRRRAQGLVVAALFVGLVFLGPFLNRDLARTSFAHEEPYLRFTARRENLADAEVPAVYSWLASAAPGPVLEIPWHPVWRVSRATEIYQRRHRRPVVVAVFGAVFGNPRLAFRNMVPAHPDGLLASRARWLVVHRNVAREEARVDPNGVRPDLRPVLRVASARQAAALRAAWGRADHVDGDTWCWDLERVRAARRQAGRTN